MRRRTFLAACGAPAIAGALGGAGCRRRSPDSLIVAVSPQLTMAPLYLAVERGLFTRRGLDVRIERFRASEEAVPALAGGKLDAALLAISPAIINAVTRGARLRVVAGRDHVRAGCRDVALLIRRKAFPEGFTDVRQLLGRRVCLTQRSSVTLYYSDLLLEPAGLSHRDLTNVPLGFVERLHALVRGEIDAAVSAHEAGLIRPEWESEIAVGLELGRIAPNLQITFIEFGARLIDGDPAVGTQFLDGYVEAVRAFAAGDTPDFMREYAESNNLDYERIRTSCRTAVSLDGAIDEPSLQRALDWNHRHGFVDRRVAAAEVMDLRFVDAVRRLREERG
jgi:NitT/TauT family transport system substrate-binding protein